MAETVKGEAQVRVSFKSDYKHLDWSHLHRGKGGIS